MTRTSSAIAFDDGPITIRQPKRELDAALAAMDRDDTDTTVQVSPEEHRRLVIEAFETLDEDITLDAIHVNTRARWSATTVIVVALWVLVAAVAAGTWRLVATV